MKRLKEKLQSGMDALMQSGLARGKFGLWLPVGAALFLVVLLLNLGLTQFLLKGYLAQDGFAVPQGSLDTLLKKKDDTGAIQLENLTLGEAVYTRGQSSGDYYVGEDKVRISSGYPLYTQSGQVLYFLDDGLKLVTEDWETLSTYEGLYLSDGVTFNADRAQADIARTLLVQVDGGYQVAQKTTLSSTLKDTEIPMNAVCSFQEDSVVYYAYQNGTLRGGQADVPAGTAISIGGQSYDYLDFLKKLGLWEEQQDRPEQPTQEPAEEPQPEQPEEEDGGQNSAARPAGQQPAQSGDTSFVPVEEPQEDGSSEGKKDNQGQQEKPDSNKQPQAPSGELEKPSAPKPSANGTPAKPADPLPPKDPNPGYQEPKVSFGDTLTPWVYTLTTTATVEDPGQTIKSGVQIYVYKVDADGKESQVLRRAVTASGTVTLGQLPPNTTFHVVAQYTYKDKLNYPQNKELDLGTATTLPFDQVGSIALGYYEENSVPVGGAPVEVFSNSLQLRQLVFTQVSNGTVTEDGGVTSHPDTDPGKAETYVNSFVVTAAVRDGNSSAGTALRMSASALRLLREGYTLSHWETPEQLSSGTYYNYTVSAQDRYGNEFTLVAPDGGRDPVHGSGHTCKEAPTVQIRVPNSGNVSGSTQIDITWKNPDNAKAEPNTTDDAAMGDKMTAAVYLVPQGSAVVPGNAVELAGYPLGEPDHTTTGKFLPVTVNSDGTVTTVSTSWVVTNLPMLQNFTAGVLCGHYDCDDGKDHRDETLKETTDFLTASLSNLGSISYTAQVDQLNSHSGRLMFRMDPADARLVKLVSSVSFGVKERASEEDVGTITLRREDLSAAAITYTRDENGQITGGEATAQVSVVLNGETKTAAMGLLWNTLPEKLGEEDAPTTVWDFLTATSATGQSDGCWLTLTLGGELDEDGTRLLDLKSTTAYVGQFTTKASQGGVEEDVTSASSRPVYFTTLSQEASVYMSNAFVSKDFIELYDFYITDPDQCILPDNADRDGSNAVIRIVNSYGVQVAVKYINAQDTYSDLRISGLENEQEYTMYVSALRYSNGGTVEKMYDLPYAQPQDTAEPTVYRFTTGESVTGDLNLVSVSQLYQNADFSTTASLGLLSTDDFYTGVWQMGGALYYSTNHDSENQEDNGKDTTALENYLEKATRGTELYYESDPMVKEAVDGSGSYMHNYPITRYTANQSVLTLMEDSWTSRFIAVKPGEKYVIYNTTNSSYFRVSFYYRYTEKDGSEHLRHYGEYNSGYYMQGNVFEVPSQASGGTANADKICYIRISGSSRRVLESMIFEQYDPKQAADSANLVTPQLYISEGMQLNLYNSVIYNKVYAYTDYIPVTSGSIYELKGRDPNIAAATALTGNTGSSGYVLFYGKDYTFLGSYLVGNQTALVKAPFGAAYCRINLTMDQSQKDSSGNSIIQLDRTGLSMKLYKSAKQDEYMATMRVHLLDLSAPEKQLLKPGGSYTVTLYTTTGSVSDSDDLEKADYTELSRKTVQVTENDQTEEGKLSLLDSVSFGGLSPNMGFKAVLSIQPESWKGGSVALDTVYFTSNRVVHTISDLEGLLAMRDDPAGSYVVTADIDGLNSYVLNTDRPFTGTIDFQGHTVTTSSFNALFANVSSSGVVKNLVLDYNATNTSAATAAKAYYGGVATVNRGTLRNIILHYKPDNVGYGIDMQDSGGICRDNYGLIDGFVVQFMKDIKVGYNFGGICRTNRGTIINGYVCTATVQDEDTFAERDARLIHVWKRNGVVLSGDSQHIAYGVANNSPQAVMSNVYVLGDLVVESDDASTDYSNSDFETGNGYTNSHYENSVTNTRSAGILVGENQGQLSDCFVTGDRRDHVVEAGQWSYMLDRGPAVAHVSGQFSAENVTYFSPGQVIYSQQSKVNANIGTFNVRGEFESLYDYQWYESVLGVDGNRFEIRQRIDDGYYPQLVLPTCFAPDAQPDLPLPKQGAPKVEVLYNEVRLQGEEAALVTVSLKYADWETKPVTGFTIAGKSGELDCEVLAQRAVDDTYRVDILLTQGTADAGSSYTIRGVTLGQGGSQEYISLDSTDAGAREVKADFWQKIGSVADWQQYVIGDTNATNYLLTADLDFSQCTNGADWYCNQNFYATLNGGIYLERDVQLTSEAGEVLMQDGMPRTIRVWGDVIGMHEISGIGNMGRTAANGDWTYMASRDKYNNGKNVAVRSLFNNLYGTLENIVFRDFHSTLDEPVSNSTYSGVVRTAKEGSQIENCHVRDGEFYSTQFAGGLVAYAGGATIRNSSVRNVSVTTFRPDPNSTYTVEVGALAGRLYNSIISTSFAADVQIKVPDVYATNGIGALAGWVYSTVMEDCYSTGSIDAYVGRVGGIAGQMSGDSILSGCWSTASVSTVADYAGGIVGYHAGGQLTNNFTASTVMTRSLTATAVHRICSITAFDENNRRDNYAYTGQYLTYTNPNPAQGESMYQFGVWEERDGASDLLDTQQLSQGNVWSSVIGVGTGYDLSNTGKTATGLLTSVGLGVEQGYLPKLMDSESGYLLYDQPDVAINAATGTRLGNVSVQDGASGTESFLVNVTIYCDREDLLTAKTAEELMDVSGISVIGGEAVLTSNWDQRSYTDQATGETGRRIQLQINYGKDAQSGGHYLDSYVLSIPVKNSADSEAVTVAQVRISLTTPVYRDIKSVQEWNDFFSDPRFATSYENVRLIKSTNTDAVFNFTSDDKLNVRVNRLVGLVYTENGVQKVPVIQGDIWFSGNSMSLVGQVVAEMSNLSVKDLTLHGTKQGTSTPLAGSYRGVVGQLHGNLINVDFTDVVMEGGASSYVGMVGVIYGEVSNVHLKNIQVTSTGQYVGGLTGLTEISSNLKNVTLTADQGKRNTITSTGNNYVGGLVGRMNGLANDQLEMENSYQVDENREPHIVVEDTDVTGPAFVGGIVGYAQSDGGRPDDFKIVNARVGKAVNSGEPGISGEPNVTVTLSNKADTTTSYVGGAVGYGDDKSMANIKVYNTLVDASEKAVNDKVTDDASTEGYPYYAGGIVGNRGNGLRNSLAENCTVITYGGAAGGVSGYHAGEYNRARNCVVGAVSPNATRVGGVVGHGYVVRCTGEHNVVFGGRKVGGLIGETLNILIQQNGVVDSLVVGRSEVGGMFGLLYNHNAYSNYVTGSLNEDGSKSASITVTDKMLREGAASYGSLMKGTHTGTEVIGTENVGGLAGRSAGLNIHDSSVSSGVSVKGDTNVGGLFGQYYGWYGDFYSTYERTLDNCAVGADVTGKDWVGGIMGDYAQYDASSNRVTTKEGPRPKQMYGLLMTGSVTATEGSNVHVLMPGLGTAEYPAYDWNDTTGKTGFGFGYTRVAADATVNGKKAGDVYDGVYKFIEDWRKPAAPSSRTDDYRDVLLVSAESLTDRNLYFGERNKTYGGMGWSRNYWADDALQAMYAQQTQPADWSTYQTGIIKPSSPNPTDGEGRSALVLWLDGRNNTGKGYTDESALVWTDLSGRNNDATLYWNNKSGKDSSYTFSERNTVMRWNDGGLEFLGGNANYYAQLQNSLSPYLNTGSGFTVELIYTYVTPEYTNHSSILSWKSGAIYGGFHGYYSPWQTYDHALIHYNVNTAGNDAVNTAVSGVREYSSVYCRTAAFVYDGDHSLSYYLNGKLVNTNTNASALKSGFPVEDIQWRIGQGKYTHNQLRVCGIRVYNKSLSETDIKQNETYDQWYYFGGAKPENAGTPNTSLKLGTDGTVSGSYQLFRSEDGSYNGTLVNSSYTGQGLGSRGYYYVSDGNGHYSNVVKKLTTGYGPRLQTYPNTGEYYGTPPTFHAYGQEGMDANGKPYDVDDLMFYGGYALPAAGLVDRGGHNGGLSTASLFTADLGILPEITAYASGADRVNLELLDDVPEGLEYAIFAGTEPEAGAEPVLSGLWPADSRTLTMTWDFTTPITLRLTLGEDHTDVTWRYNDLARSVMTYGSGFWYLYGTECYNAAGESLDESKVFLHMMNGQLLDQEGNLWNAADMSSAGTVTPFTLCQPQPIWAGTVSGVAVESFGTYLKSGERVQPTQLVVRGSQAYTMPDRDVVVGSFVTDTYLDQCYTTVLGTDGKLCDLGQPLTYPQDFTNRGIREISSSLDYHGTVVLVRYTTGKLVAFNYLSGELLDVKSQESQSISLKDFFLENFGGFFGSQSLISGGAQQAQDAMDYQNEVSGSAPLQSALAALGNSKNNGTATDGQASGVDSAGQPGGQDGPAGPGVDGDQGIAPAPDNGMGVVDGEGVPSGNAPGENGQIPVNGPGGENGDGVGQPDGSATGSDETGLPGEQTPGGQYDDPAQSAEDEPNEPSGGENEPDGGDSVGPAETPDAPAQQPAASGSQGNVTTRYVAIYDSKTGSSAIYDLEEYLTQPEEELVSQNERAEELSRLGFSTTLSRSTEPPAVTANGFFLFLFTGMGAVVLLVCMSVLKKKKLDRKEK